MQVILVNKNCLRLLIWIYLKNTDYFLCVFWCEIRAAFVFKTFEQFSLSPPDCIGPVEAVALSSNLGVAGIATEVKSSSRTEINNSC